jgi:dTDP-L-rhamnose 4-epimerase
VRVLVTGGSGFVGSHVVDVLVEAGHDVVVLDRRPPLYENHGATYVLGDIRDPDSWSRVLRGTDAITHQAARVGLGRHFSDITEYVQDNDVGTAVMLRALDQVGFAGRLVLAGSMVVYGEGSYRCPRCGPVRPGPRSVDRLAAGMFEPPCPGCGSDLASAAVGEAAPVDPRNVYAATKVQQEHLVAAFGRVSGAPVISLRYHNVFGPRCPIDTPYSGVASLFVSALRQGEAPRVFEDGRQRRDFVHVRDVARANLLALEAGPGVTGPFNIASGEPHTIAELAQALAEALTPSGPGPLVTGEWRLGDVRHIVASPEKANRELGFAARVSFAQGMAELAGLSAAVD